MKNDIPIHQLQDRTNCGLQLEYFGWGDIPKDKADALGAHRDDHYIFFFLQKGSASLMLDFHEITLSPGTLYYILPAQVHHRIQAEQGDGWFMAIDTLLVHPDFRNVFEHQLWLQQPYTLTETQFRQCNDLLCLLHEKYKEDNATPFYMLMIHSLAHSFLGMAAQYYNRLPDDNVKQTRPVQLSREFKKLLAEQIRSVKSPSAYAALLHVSESYLNEAMKKITGFPVSYWIQQEVMLEAKRLLYYSQLNVKEIAHLLGYEDHSYFSRYFRKVVGVSALEFRQQYRK